MKRYVRADDGQIEAGEYERYDAVTKRDQTKTAAKQVLVAAVAALRQLGGAEWQPLAEVARLTGYSQDALTSALKGRPRYVRTEERQVRIDGKNTRSKWALLHPDLRKG